MLLIRNGLMHTYSVSTSDKRMLKVAGSPCPWQNSTSCWLEIELTLSLLTLYQLTFCQCPARSLRGMANVVTCAERPTALNFASRLKISPFYHSPRRGAFRIASTSS